MVYGSVNDVVLPEHGIALALFHSDLGGGHLGVLFNEKGNKLRLMELGWHHKLFVSDLPRPKCGIAIPLALPPAASKGVLAVVRAISRKLPKISYGIDFIASKGSFNGSVYSPPRGSNGLTCASFVLEVMRSAAVLLIHEESWEPSPSNTEWATEVVKLLREHGAEEKHIEAVEKGMSNLRLIPFELAAAATLPVEQRPASYTAVQQIAGELRNHLDRVCPLPAQPIIPSILRAG
jgi:hypothetical protein